MTPEEDQQLRVLGNALTVVADWEQITGQPSGAWQVEADSDLAHDDALSHPYGTSSAAWTAITAAVSHAGCLRDSLFLWTGPERVTVRLHTHGQLTLLRGALENASRAVWLLEPNDRASRVLRRLQQEWAEVRELESVRAIVGSPSTRTLDARLEELSQLAQSAGADPSQIKKGPGYREIVENAGTQTTAGSRIAVLIWKACSAIAHGELRGPAAYLPAESLGQAAPGMTLNRVTANVLLTVTGTMAALATTKIALDLYAKRTHV